MDNRFDNLNKYWDINKNKENIHSVSFESHKKVWFICEKGHSWEAIVRSVSNGSGCPYCSGHKVLKGYNDIVTTHPNCLTEWDFVKNTKENIYPYKISKGARKSVWWVCDKGHSYKMDVYNKIGSNQRCPYCTNRKVLIGFNDLLTINPSICEEWDYEKNIKSPEEYVYNSCYKVWWKCKKGHIWKTSIENRNRNGHGCILCYEENKESRIATAIKQYCINNYNDVIVEYPAFQSVRSGHWFKYDIFIKSLKMYIEIHGGQHYLFVKYWHKTMDNFIRCQNNDRDKKEYAKKNGNYIEIDLREIKTIDDAIKFLKLKIA